MPSSSAAAGSSGGYNSAVAGPGRVVAAGSREGGGGGGRRESRTPGTPRRLAARGGVAGRNTAGANGAEGGGDEGGAPNGHGRSSASRSNSGGDRGSVPPPGSERTRERSAGPLAGSGTGGAKAATTPSTGAVHDHGLRDYRLGECLGKGAFGSVYKAFNWNTGEAVAVKQIRLADLPKSELRMIEAEIDLLKNLHHDNIVKYLGFVKSVDCLNIVLELCESGSLHSICKAYGKFPENLVGVYMTQVLQGLQYLHDQGVIHRDIKGANILTTKDGTVKLADFGVSTSTLAGPDKEAQVVGTPYWMAPEIIQLSGATPASDIWSVGCTVIELLQGRPPYHNLAAMPALFAIVNDDHPPLPEGVSPAARDFLMQCFQKDPNLRVSAGKLLRHAWIVGCRKSGRKGGDNRDAAGRPGGSQGAGDKAVEEVKLWNKALKQSSETSLRQSQGADGGVAVANGHHHHQQPPHGEGQHFRSADMASAQAAVASRRQAGHVVLAKPRAFADALGFPELEGDDVWDDDFDAISPGALRRPHLKTQDHFGGLFSSDRLKALALGDGGVASPPPTGDAHDDRDGLLTIKGPAQQAAHLLDAESQEHTIRPIFRRVENRQSAEALARKAALPNANANANANGINANNSRPKSPGKSHFAAKFEVPARLDTAYFESVEDYSDLNVENDSVFSRPHVHMAVRRADDAAKPTMQSQHAFVFPQPGVNNATSLPPRLAHSTSSPPLATGVGLGLTSLSSSSTTTPTGGVSRRPAPPKATRSSVLPERPPTSGGGVGASAAPTVPTAKQLRRTRSSVSIQRFAEDDGDADFSDMTSEADGGELVLARMNGSWLLLNGGGGVAGGSGAGGEGEDDDDFFGSGSGGAGSGGGVGGPTSASSAAAPFMGAVVGAATPQAADDDEDPFAGLDPAWDELDLEANIARDRHARLGERVEELVRSLKTTEGEDRLAECSEDLLNLLWENDDVKDFIIGAHGLLPILEILEPCTVKSRQTMVLHLLKIVNMIILDDVELQENLCFVGGIPIITKFAARQYSTPIRLEAAAFVRQMYQTSTLTLQMFVSAGGLNVLVQFLDEDYDTARDLVLIAVDGIWNVFELQGPTPKNDFCRIFSRSKILLPLALILRRVLGEDSADDELAELEGRIVNIFYLFSQAENYVKEVVADRHVLKNVLRDLGRMTPVHQITMLKFIKNLSMLSTTLDSLHSADAIDFLIEVLGQSMETGQKHFREMSNQVLNTLFNLCRLSKDRQEYAAVNGIIPLLLRIMQTDRPPKEFALPILCDMAHSGSKGRRYLWQNKGLDFYISLLADQYWQVTALDAIFVWLQEETAKVEAYLLGSEGSTGGGVSTTGSGSPSSAGSGAALTKSFSDAIVSCFYAGAASSRRPSSTTSLQQTNGSNVNNNNNNNNSNNNNSSSNNPLLALANAGAFDSNILEPLLKLLRLSPAVAASLARPDMFAGLAHKLLSHRKAVVRLNLLRLVRAVMDGARAAQQHGGGGTTTGSDEGNSPGSVASFMAGVAAAAAAASHQGGGNSIAAAAAAMATPHGQRQLRALLDAIQTLADRDAAVLVRNLAGELLRSHGHELERQQQQQQKGSGAGSGPNSRPGTADAARPGSSGARDERGSSAGASMNVAPSSTTSGHQQQRPLVTRSRRTTSYTTPTPPSLHTSLSMPPPPPPLQSSSSGYQQRQQRQTPVTPTHHRSQSHQQQQYHYHYYHQQHHRPSLSGNAGSSSYVEVASSSGNSASAPADRVPTTPPVNGAATAPSSVGRGLPEREKKPPPHAHASTATALYRPRSRDSTGSSGGSSTTASTGIPRRVSGDYHYYQTNGAGSRGSTPTTPTSAAATTAAHSSRQRATGTGTSTGVTVINGAAASSAAPSSSSAASRLPGPARGSSTGAATSVPTTTTGRGTHAQQQQQQRSTTARSDGALSHRNKENVVVAGGVASPSLPPSSYFEAMANNTTSASSRSGSGASSSGPSSVVLVPARSRGATAGAATASSMSRAGGGSSTAAAVAAAAAAANANASGGSTATTGTAGRRRARGASSTAASANPPAERTAVVGNARKGV